MTKPAITGIGPISAIGTGIELYAESLKEGESGIQDIKMGENHPYPAHTAGIIEDFEVDEFLSTPKNYLDRNSELSFAAFDLALENSCLEIDPSSTEKTALIWGTAFGGTDTMNRFYTDIQTKGPRFGKPILFPHTYSNTGISLLSIEHSLSGPHMHFSSGWTASAHSLAFGCDLINTHRANPVFCGGAEAFSETILKYCLGKKICSPTDDGKELCRPFDQKVNGIVVGEGGGTLVLEDVDKARKRKAEIYAIIGGIGMANQPGGWHNGTNTAITAAMRQAITKANLTPEKIDCVYASANGYPEMDSTEGDALEKLFGKSPSTGITSIKPLIGETFGAGGVLQASAAIVSLCYNFIPPTLNVDVLRNSWNFNLVRGTRLDKPVNSVLINNLDPGGSVVSMVLIKP